LTALLQPNNPKNLDSFKHFNTHPYHYHTNPSTTHYTYPYHYKLHHIIKFNYILASNFTITLHHLSNPTLLFRYPTLFHAYSIYL